jgi:hypothetical protein
MQAAHRAALDAIPAEMRERRQWVNADAEKEPVNPMTGGNAKNNNAATWGTFAQARAGLRRWARVVGLGFEFSPDDPYVGLDLDGAYDDAGALRPWARELLAHADGRAYIERSVSGRGIHIILRASCPALPKILFGGEHHNLAVFRQNCYFRLTGDVLPGSVATLPDAQGAMDAIIRRFWPETTQPAQPARRAPHQAVKPIFADSDYDRAAAALERLAPWRCDDYHEWLRVGLALHDLGPGGLALWDTWSQRSSKYRPDEPARKWQSFKAGAVTLATLFFMAAVDDPQPTQPGGRIRQDAETTQTGPTQTAAGGSTGPARDPLAAYRLTPDDWRACPLCAFLHVKTGVGGILAQHWICGRAGCPVADKLRLQDNLQPLTAWGALYIGHIEAIDARRIRDRVKRAGGASVAIPRTDGGLLVAASVAFDGAADVPFAAAADALASAIGERAGRIRKPQTVKPEAHADEEALRPVNVAEGGNVKPLSVPPDCVDLLTNVWDTLGIQYTRKGGGWEATFADLQQRAAWLKAMPQLRQQIAARLGQQAFEAYRQLIHRGRGASCGSIDDPGSQTGAIGHPAGDLQPIRAAGTAETHYRSAYKAGL